MKVRIVVQNNALKKVSLTKFLRAEAGLALNVAKAITDRLLEEGIDDFVIEQEISIDWFVARAEQLGATVESISREGNRSPSNH